MDDSIIRLALLLLAFAGMSTALQVTPSSPCSNVCLNDVGASSISGVEIFCNDKDYSKPLGKRFQKCVECLQTSSFGTEVENDQAWLLYNLRFAADWCMYAPENSQKINGPCMDAATCGGLESALDVGNGDLGNSTTFNYCEKNSGKFARQATICNGCVQHMPENKYLSNWILALEAGCSQRPSQKVLLGLTGSIFSDETVIISASLSPDDPKLRPKNENEHLPMSAIIGVIVGAVVITLMIAGVVGYKCWKKRQACKDIEINSRCHSRFGVVEIPAPLDCAYSEYKPEPVVEVAPRDEDYMMKEMKCGSWTSEHTKQSSVSSDNSIGRLGSHKDQTKAISMQAADTRNGPSQQALRHSQELMTQQALSDPAPRSRAASLEPDGNSSQVNPLRMNSFHQHSASVASIGVAVTAPQPVDMPTPSQFLPQRFTPTSLRHISTPPQPIPTPPPPVQLPARSTRSARKPPPLILNTSRSRAFKTQAQPSEKPGYASTMISSTSTTFSPGVYQTLPPSYQSPVGPIFKRATQTPSQQPSTVPLATYNPADYAQKITKPCHQPQPQFNTQQRLYSSTPQQSYMALHRPQASVESSSSRFSFISSKNMPSPPPPPLYTEQFVPKQKGNAVPIIAMPIPAPKRKTLDMRDLLGMNLKHHVSPMKDDVPVIPNPKIPKGLDRTESLLAKSSPPFRSLARNLNTEAAMTLPEVQERAAPTLDEGTIQVQRPDSRASYRGRSVSRPRRENIPHDHSSQERSGRERSRSVQHRFRSGSRDIEGGNGRKGPPFSFGFRSQDSLSAVDSPESGNKSTDVEQWPGKMQDTRGASHDPDLNEPHINLLSMTPPNQA